MIWRYTPYEPPTPTVRLRDEPLVSELEVAVERHLDLSGIELERLAGSESVGFGRKKAPLIYIFADEAVQIHGGRRISGDFRAAAGEHWTELRALLLEVQGVRNLPVTATSFERLLTSFPSLPSELVGAALQASARIRADLRVFPCPVVLESATYQVRFEPIRRYPRLLVPFSVRRRGELDIEAALDLTSVADPIGVAFEDSADESQVIEAWPVALLAFADLIGTHASGGREEAQTSSRQRGLRLSDARRAGMARRLLGQTDRRLHSSMSSNVLKPVGETANHQGSFVVGHRRHLPPGQTCGDEARAAARVYGIDLAPGWTWVQPHERGIPEGFVLRHTWQMPSQLAGVDSLSSA
jgi:hypothetical protein